LRRQAQKVPIYATLNIAGSVACCTASVQQQYQAQAAPGAHQIINSGPWQTACVAASEFVARTTAVITPTIMFSDFRVKNCQKKQEVASADMRSLIIACPQSGISFIMFIFSFV
jgi:hypothetical protein